MAAMGRRRESDLHLPPRMRRKGHAFYYDCGGRPRKWIPLGSDESRARLKWAELENKEHGETITYLIEHYFGSRVPQLAANTQKNYRSMRVPLERSFGHMLIREVTHEDVATYLDEHYSKAAANQQIALFSAIFERALRRGWSDKNPCKGIRRHSLKRRGRYLTDDEYRAIREHASPVLRVAMDLSYLTSLRPCDIVKIKRADVRADGLYVEQKKTGRRQLYEMTPALKDVLDAAKALTGSVAGLTLLSNARGRPYPTWKISHMFTAAARAAKVEDAQLRDIRAKAATDAKEAGQDYQALLGHTSRSMSDSYIKPKLITKVEPLRRKL